MPHGNALASRSAFGLRRDQIALVTLLCGAIAIAFSPIFVRLSELAPTATAFHRAALATPLLWLWLACERGGAHPPQRPRSRRDFLLLALAGVWFAGDLAFWHWSIRYTSIANSTLFANMAPIFVTIGAWALFGERFRPSFLLAVAVTIGGGVVLMGESLSISAQTLTGDALGMVTAAFYGAYMLTVARLRSRFSTVTIMAWSCLTTAIVLLPVALATGEAMLPPSLYGWTILIGLAWISHAAGQGLIAYSLAHLTTAFSAVALLFQPVIAALLGWVIIGEALTLLQAAGGIIVLVGIFMARRASRPRP